MVESKKYDWFATMMFQPELTLNELPNLGITANNTVLENRDYYKKLPEIQKAFTNNNNDFDDKKFDAYYTSLNALYNQFSVESHEKNLFENFDYDPFDFGAPMGSSVADVTPKIGRTTQMAPPSLGITHYDSIGSSNLSLREIAQAQPVVDYTTGKKLDWTPNDKGGLFSGLVRPTLVYATWDEDGEHIENGRTIKHQKGEPKYNEDGNHYTELLGNRSLRGKEVVRYSDTLTEEASWMNKYDFLDADGVDKNIGSTIARTALLVAPMFIPGVGPIYGRLTAGMEAAKFLPVISDAVSAILTGEGKAPQWMHNLAGWSESFSPGVSDAGKKTFWNFENVANLAFTASTQLFQQKFVGQIPLWLTEKGVLQASPWTYKAGRMMSLGYMAATSSRETYDQFKEAGADDRTAGIGMIMSMVSMYQLMRLDYFRDALFQGTWLDESSLRLATKTTAQKLAGQFEKMKGASPKAVAEFIKKGSSILTNHFKNSNFNASIFNRMLNEGIEETMEEVNFDLIKGFHAGLNALGIPMGEQQLDFGFNLGDMAGRYMTSFFGGAIGGAMFGAHELAENIRIARKTGDGWRLPKGDEAELVYAISQGRAPELYKTIDKGMRTGYYGSLKLSGTNFTTRKGVNGEIERIAEKAESVEDSQSYVIGNFLKSTVERIENILKSNGVVISDQELQEKLQKSLSNDVKGYDHIAEAVIKYGNISSMFEDYQNTINGILDKQIKLDGLIASNSSPEEIAKTRTELNDFKETARQITEGEKNPEYFEHSMFTLNSAVNEGFTGINFKRWLYVNHSKLESDLSPEEKERLELEFKNQVTVNGVNGVRQSYNLFTTFLNKFSNQLLTADAILKDSDLKESVYTTTGEIGNSGIINYSAQTYYQLVDDYTIKIEELNKELKITPTTDTDRIQILSSEIAELTKIKDFLITHPELLILSKDNSKVIDTFTPLLETITTQYNASIVGNKDASDLINLLPPDHPSRIERQEKIAKAQSELTNLASVLLNRLNLAKNSKMPMDLNNADLKVLLEALSTLIKIGAIPSPVALYDQGNSTLNIEGNDIVDHMDSEDGTEETAYPVAWNAPATRGFLFQQLLIQFTNSIGKNVSDLMSKWEEIKQFLANTKIEPNEREAILDLIQPMVGQYRLMDYIAQYNKIKSEGTKSFVAEMLQSMYSASMGQNSTLLDLFESQINAFENSDSIENFTFSNPNVAEEIGQLKEMLLMMGSVVRGVTNYNGTGYTVSANQLRKKNKMDLLPEISEATERQLVTELARYDSKLDLLLKIHNQNSGIKSIQEQKITIQAKVNFYKAIRGKFEDIKREFDIDLQEIWDMLDKDPNIDYESYPTSVNFDKHEAAYIAFESAFRDAFIKKFSDPVEIAAKLMNVVGTEATSKMESSRLTASSPRVTNYDLLVYLPVVLSVDSTNFYKRYNQLVNSQELQQFAPLYSQELAIRIIQARHLNAPLYNAILDELTKLNPTKSIYYNMSFVDGATGAGKTTVVAFVSKLLNDIDDQAIATAPNKNQAENLREAIGGEGYTYSRVEFFDKVLEGDKEFIRVPDVVVSNNDNTVGLKMNPSVKFKNAKDIFKNEKNRIVFLDEYSHFSRPEFEAMSKWAKSHNVHIVAFGDPIQTGRVEYAKQINDDGTDGMNYTFELGFDDGVRIKTPKLTSNIRSGTLAQVDNFNIMHSVLSLIEDKNNVNGGTTTEHADNAAIAIFQDKEFKLKYFENETSFTGAKIINERDKNKKLIKEKIAFLKGLIIGDRPATVALLTDELQNYNDVNADAQFTKYDSKQGSIQGLEFDYIIIDTPFPASKFGAMKYFYTMSQRARRGALVNDRNLSERLPEFTTVFTQGVNVDVKFTQDQIDKYREWRNKSLSKFTGDPEEFIQIEAEQVEEIDTENGLTIKGNPAIETVESNEVENPEEKKPSDGEPASGQNPNPLEETGTKPTSVEPEGTNTNPPEKPVEPQLPSAPPSKPIVQHNQATKKSNRVKEDLHEKVGNNFETSKGDDFYAIFNDNTLLKFEEKRTDSLFNVLFPKLNVSKYKQVIDTLRFYFLEYNEDSRGDDKGINTLHSTLLDLLGTDYDTQVSKLIDALDKPNYEIIPYNKDINAKPDSGLLSGIIEIDGKRVFIPLLITRLRPGIYNGRVKRMKGPTLVKNDGQQKATSLKNLDQNGNFISYQNPFILVLDNEIAKIIRESSPQGTNEFVNGRKGSPGNIGQVFILVTDDKLATPDDFRNYVRVQINEKDVFTNMVANDSRFRMIAVHRTTILSHIIKLHRVQAQKISQELKNVKQNERYLVYDKYNTKENWILSPEQVGRLTTDLLSIYLKTNKTSAEEAINKDLQLPILTHLATQVDRNMSPVDAQHAIRVLSRDGHSFIITKENTTRLESEYKLYLEDETNHYSENPIVTSKNLSEIINAVKSESKLNYTAASFRTELIDIRTSDRHAFRNFNPNIAFYELTKLCEEGTFNDLDTRFQALPQYKNGINLNDSINEEKTTDGYWFDTLANDEFTIRDVDKISASDYSIDLNAVTTRPKHTTESVNNFNTDIDNLNILLKEMNAPWKVNTDKINVNDIDNLDQYLNKTINDFNELLKENANSSRYWQIRSANSKELVEDNINLINNILRRRGIQGEVSSVNEINRNLILFNVSLNDQIQGYKLTITNDVVELIEYNSGNSYIELDTFIKSKNEGIPNTINDINTLDYISNIINFKSPTNEEALAYFNTVVNFGDDPLISELNMLVTNFLMSNLENNEC